MVSARCRGRSLVNHCRQVGKPSDLKIEYIQRKFFLEELDLDYSKNPLAWVCIMTFSNKRFIGCHLKKTKSLEVALIFGEESLLENIKKTN